MLPRWHILLGAIFTLIIWFFAPNINPIYLGIIFFSSFLMDFDHYFCALIKSKKLSLFKSFDYHREERIKEFAEKKKGIRNKGDFHFFHTIEAHLLVAIIGIFWIPFFYILTGMIFHSLFDLGYLLYTDRFYRREYFFALWLAKKMKK